MNGCGQHSMCPCSAACTVFHLCKICKCYSALLAPLRLPWMRTVRCSVEHFTNTTVQGR